MINYKHHNPKQIVSTVAFVLERRLKLKWCMRFDFGSDISLAIIQLDS